MFYYVLVSIKNVLLLGIICKIRFANEMKIKCLDLFSIINSALICFSTVIIFNFTSTPQTTLNHYISLKNFFHIKFCN